jgi:hypothetical protein
MIVDDWAFYVNAFRGEFNATRPVTVQVDAVTSLARKNAYGGVYVIPRSFPLFRCCLCGAVAGTQSRSHCGVCAAGSSPCCAALPSLPQQCSRPKQPECAVLLS